MGGKLLPPTCTCRLKPDTQLGDFSPSAGMDVVIMLKSETLTESPAMREVMGEGPGTTRTMGMAKRGKGRWRWRFFAPPDHLTTTEAPGAQ